MDYNNTKKYIQKWQWKIMRTSERWVLPLLYLFLSLISCSTQKQSNYIVDCSVFLSKNIPDTIYFGDVVCSTNYSITESEKTYPFPKNKYKKIEEIKTKNGETLRVGKFIREDKVAYSYDTIKDTLGFKKTKYRTYYSDGKVESIHYSLGSLSIGKWYFFMEKGNVVKDINEEEGWNLCWEQIYFIATRFIGKNMLNDISTLSIDRYNPYDAIEKGLRKIPYEKRMWFLSYYYKDCRFVVDVEDETGIVINHRKIPQNTACQVYDIEYFED